MRCSGSQRDRRSIGEFWWACRSTHDNAETVRRADSKPAASWHEQVKARADPPHAVGRLLAGEVRNLMISEAGTAGRWVGGGFGNPERLHQIP